MLDNTLTVGLTPVVQHGIICGMSAPTPPPPPANHAVKPPLRSRTWFLIALPVVALLVGIGVGSGESKTAKAAPAVTTTATETAVSTTTETATVTTTPTKVVATHTVQVRVTYTPPPKNVITDGTYVVGTDIPAGVYRTNGQGDSGSCYWARLSSLSTQDIIDNGNISGQTTTQVAPSDRAFEISGGCTWSKVG